VRGAEPSSHTASCRPLQLTLRTRLGTALTALHLGACVGISPHSGMHTWTSAALSSSHWRECMASTHPA
jgi:hypothetical protein